ncbi:hypothetical protein, partial [Paramagnetospirillum marisnigri]|uniref:hypothetical protein n=1 Tax=Paramagnetospirillum marisnigri TaxID=1285242 RepID=UPI001C1298D9
TDPETPINRNSRPEQLSNRQNEEVSGGAHICHSHSHRLIALLMNAADSPRSDRHSGFPVGRFCDS